MQLDYLDFDFSDEEDGHGSFDAMASVTAERLPALFAEIDCVRNWATAAFGANAGLEDGGEWDCEVQRTDETGASARTTVTFTLSGSPAFCDAFRDKFEVPG
ncbi:hypothetical protein ACSFA3_11650 [Variovorax sp. RHLX14]|uniref:hypothetical protein n=1 Tax=Variovorax sp. RHLX14 TaxID=1259731 RepID=UPI003F456040